MWPTIFEDFKNMTDDEFKDAMRKEIDRRIMADPEMQAAIAADEEEEVNRILYGDPDAHDGPKVRIDASQWIVKET